ncbi:unnamed protein product, partial [Rotaria sp. Silwood1]
MITIYETNDVTPNSYEYIDRLIGETCYDMYPHSFYLGRDYHTLYPFWNVGS